MKSIYFYVACLLCYTCMPQYVQAQGWIGTGNIIYAVNSNRDLSPLSVGIGTSSPTAQFHTTGTLRFQGLGFNNILTRMLVADANGNLFLRDLSTITSTSAWSLNGNSGTTPGIAFGQNYLGTTDNKRLVFATNATERMTILNTNGNVGIGTNSPTHKLSIASTNLNDGIMIQNNIANSNGGEISF